MNRKTPVELKCGHCGVIYFKPPSVAKKSKYCCAECFKAATAVERKEIECECCGTVFSAGMDHGKWPRFCSRECFSAGAAAPTEKECPACGAMFLAQRSTRRTEDGLQKYCSRACAATGLERGEHRTCLNCGSHFYAKAQKAQLRETGCCSSACQYAYYVGARHGNFKNGWVGEVTGIKFIPHKREGYVSPYAAEHRVIASKAVGRTLRMNEPVIHINGNNADNSPENLYVCDSISTMRKIYNGSIPRPAKSNLEEYA